LDRVEEKREVEEQEDIMEGVKERSSGFSLVTYSVRTRAI